MTAYLSALAALLFLRFVFGFQLHALGVLHAPRGLPRLRIDRHLALYCEGPQIAERLLHIDVVLDGMHQGALNWTQLRCSRHEPIDGVPGQANRTKLFRTVLAATFCSESKVWHHRMS